MNNEIKIFVIDQGYFTESIFPFTIKPNFSTLGSIIKISSLITSSGIVFTPNDIIGDLLGFKSVVLHEEHILSDYPVDILSFDNIFFETDKGQGMIYRGKRSKIIHNWTISVNPGSKYVVKFARAFSWYMMDTKDFHSTLILI